MRYYVIINGVNSLTIEGLAIKTLPPISKPAMRNIREEIDGRDGDIVTTLGYGAYDKTIEIGLFGTFDIDEVIAYFNQKGTITFSNEADKVYYFEALDQVDYAELLKFRTANVVLHCQPFKYPLNETPLVEEYEYVEATGTNVTLDNTSEAIFNKIDLLGNTEQTQYTGKQLFDYTKISSITNGTNNNGVITSTTNTSAGLKNLVVYYANGAVTIPANTTIYLSADIKLNSGSTGTFGTMNDNSSQFTKVKYPTLSTTYQRYQTSKTYTSSTTINAMLIQIQNLTGSIEVSNIMISTNSSETYEPYVGGIPSPNPNYPQDIHVVSGDNTIEITGRNLLDTTKMIDFTPSVATWYSVDGISGFYNESNISRGQCYYEIEAGKTYTFSVHEAINKSTAASAPIQLVNSTGGMIVSIQQNYTSNTFTATETGRAYPRMSINTANQPARCIVQLEHGNQVHDFEEYQSQRLEIDLGGTGKNLFDYKTHRISQANFGSDAIVGDSTCTLSYVRCEPNTTYTISRRSPMTARFWVATTETTPAVGVAIANKRQIQDNTTTTITITTDATSHFIVMRFIYNNNDDYDTYAKTIQVEEGNQATTYEDFVPFEMALIPGTDYKDVFVKEGDTWYKRETVGEVVLNGSETVEQQTTTSGNYRFAISGPNDMKTTNELNIPAGLLISNKFIEISNAVSYTGNTNGILVRANNTKQFMINCLETGAYTIAQFKTWLSNNNVEVRYVLETTTDIEITSETLADQLDAIKNAISYSGQTNVSQTNSDAPFILDLSALKEGSDHLVINNAGNIYAKPTMDIEGTGVVDIYLNDAQILEADLSETNNIVIDTEAMEAYNPDTNALANRQVTGDYSKIKLEPGENDLRFSGDLSKATVTKYKRWL